MPRRPSRRKTQAQSEVTTLGELFAHLRPWSNEERLAFLTAVIRGLIGRLNRHAPWQREDVRMAIQFVDRQFRKWVREDGLQSAQQQASAAIATLKEKDFSKVEKLAMLLEDYEEIVEELSKLPKKLRPRREWLRELRQFGLNLSDQDIGDIVRNQDAEMAEELLSKFTKKSVSKIHKDLAEARKIHRKKAQ